MCRENFLLCVTSSGSREAHPKVSPVARQRREDRMVSWARPCEGKAMQRERDKISQPGKWRKARAAAPAQTSPHHHPGASSSFYYYTSTTPSAQNYQTLVQRKRRGRRVHGDNWPPTPGHTNTKQISSNVTAAIRLGIGMRRRQKL